MKRTHSQFINRRLGATETSYIFKPVYYEQKYQKELIEELVESTFETFTGRQHEMFHTIYYTLDGQLCDIAELQAYLDQLTGEQASLRLHVERMSADGIFMSLNSVSEEIERTRSALAHAELHSDKIIDYYREFHVQTATFCDMMRDAREQLLALRYRMDKIPVTYL